MRAVPLGHSWRMVVVVQTTLLGKVDEGGFVFIEV